MVFNTNFIEFYELHEFSFFLNDKKNLCNS